MSERDNVNEPLMRKSFVAYNLVFGPSSNGLPVITASLLSEAMGKKGYEMSAEEAQRFLDHWYAYGQLRHKEFVGGEMEYVISG